MAVKTKSIYEPADPGDGVRVLITRYYPRGVKKDRFDRWEKALSPSRELLAAYRGGEKSWDQFKGAFLSEMSASPESAEAIRALSLLAKAQDVTLLCYEKSGLNCHRYLVAEVLSPRASSRATSPRGEAVGPGSRRISGTAETDLDDMP